MRIRIAHSGRCDLIIQSNGAGTRRLEPLSWWDWFRRRSYEIEISQNEIIVIRTSEAREPDGVAIKNHV